MSDSVPMGEALATLTKNLVFVPRMDKPEIMVTGLKASSNTFNALCTICTDPSRVKPLECSFVVHNPGGDMRYMYLCAESATKAREICTQRVNDWMQTSAE